MWRKAVGWHVEVAHAQLGDNTPGRTLAGQLPFPQCGQELVEHEFTLGGPMW
jgi:hypothetical protein